MTEEYLDMRRKEIAECDRSIMELLRKRLDLAIAIGQYKSDHGMNVKNPAVEIKVIERYRSLAEEFGMDPDNSEEICKLIMQESVANEESVQKRR